MKLMFQEFFSYFNRPVIDKTHLAFRSFFAFHLFLQSLKLPWTLGHSSGVYLVQFILFLCTFSMFFKNTFRFGLIFLFLYKLFWVWFKFPFTANHYFFELFISIFLLIFSGRAQQEPFHGTSEFEHPFVDGTGLRLIQVALLTLYFYGGLHKLIHGYWVSGEFLAQEFLSKNQGGLGWTLSHLFGGSSGPSLPPINHMTSLPVHLPSSSFFGLKVLSWLTLLTEIGIPILFLFKKTRGFGLLALLLVQVTIGFASWETEFMFLALGSALLFIREEKMKKGFLFLALLHALWNIWIIFVLDLRVGIL